MAPEPVVTFIICTYNRENYLDDTLKSIFKFNSPDSPVDLLIVDNNSEDQTKKAVQQYKQSNENIIVRYVKETQQGLSHARNRGIQEAKAEHIVFLDDDIRATQSLIPAWISFFKNHPDAMAAGGKIHVQFDDPRPQWMSHFLLPLLGYHDLGDSPKKYPKNKYPFGGHMGFKKTVFQKIGLFQTDLGRKGGSLGAGEEKELFRRLRKKDHSIFYLPNAFLYHRVNGSRLTVDYIRKQALGLGKSMKLQLQDTSTRQKGLNWISECSKLFASVPLAFGYLLTGKPAKAKLLFQFRRWIWQGYRGE